MNTLYFQGIYRCYFHVHHTNIEGWYDPQALTRERINETFGYLCDQILRHTATNDPNGAPKINNMPLQTIIQDTSRSIADLPAVPIGTTTHIAYMNLGCNKRTLQIHIRVHIIIPIVTQIMIINKHMVVLHMMLLAHIVASIHIDYIQMEIMVMHMMVMLLRIMVSANDIPNGVSSIITINTINKQTSTNASSSLMSQSFTNGNFNNSNNFPSQASSPLSPTLLPTLDGSLTRIITWWTIKSRHDIWFVFEN